LTRPAPGPDATEQQVADWLRANPGWLARSPALYAQLDPPPRVHGERVADHMQARLAAAAAREAALLRQIEALLAAGRANMAAAARIQRAVLALLAAREPIAAVAGLAELLGVESVALCAERPAPPGFRSLADGAVALLIPPGREAVLRLAPAGDAALHAEAAGLIGSEALLRLDLGPAARPALLALGAREADAFQPGQATDLLQFLAAAVAAALLRA
jgi:hypothetical protein